MGEAFNPQDAVSAKLAKGFITIDGRRELWLHIKNFEMKANIRSKDVPRLGAFVDGSKATGMGYSGKMTIYKVNGTIDAMVQRMAETGETPFFEIQTVNEDPSTKNGRDVKLYSGCHLDGDIVLSSGDAEGDFLEQEVNVKAQKMKILEKFTGTSSVIVG